MAVAIGKIHPSKPGQDNWTMYVERLGHFFVANGITTAEKKCATLLSVIGDSTYKLLSSLLYPDKPGGKSFDELVTVLKDHFSPVPSEIMKHFNFNTRFHKQGRVYCYLCVRVLFHC